MDKYIYPNEQTYYSQIPDDKNLRWKVVPPIIKKLQEKARAEGLWNLFLPSVSGLTNLEYAPLCEIMVNNILLLDIFNINYICEYREDPSLLQLFSIVVHQILAIWKYYISMALKNKRRPGLNLCLRAKLDQCME